MSEQPEDCLLSLRLQRLELKHQTSEKGLYSSGFQSQMNTMLIFLGVIFHGENLDLEHFFYIIGFFYNPEG